jgi:putative membrane protein
MSRLLLQWILSAVALLVVSTFVRGFWVEGFFSALVAALILGLLNATLGLLLKIVTFPISILTLGLFLFVINAGMILLASEFVRGFHVQGFVPALIGAVALSLLNLLFRPLVKSR